MVWAGVRMRGTEVVEALDIVMPFLPCSTAPSRLSRSLGLLLPRMPPSHFPVHAAISPIPYTHNHSLQEFEAQYGRVSVAQMERANPEMYAKYLRFMVSSVVCTAVCSQLVPCRAPRCAATAPRCAAFGQRPWQRGKRALILGQTYGQQDCTDVAALLVPFSLGPHTAGYVLQSAPA